MYPLKIRKISGYRFRERTWYSKHHLGVDYYGKRGTPIYAPFDGINEKHWGHQGGRTVYFYWDKYIMRVMHLSRFGKLGKVKEGTIIGYVGNDGYLSRGDHAHIDISKNKVDIYNINNFLDPETFNFNNKKMDYVIDEKNEQYLLDDDLKIGLNIGDKEELLALQERGLPKQPRKVINSYLKGYELYPLVRKSRWAELVKTIRDLSGF